MMFQRFILIGLPVLGVTEYFFCRAWQSWIEQSVTSAGLSILDDSESIWHVESLSSSGFLMLVWLVLVIACVILERPNRPSFKVLSATLLSVLVGANLSALLCLTTTAQILVQNALADPTGDAMRISINQLSLMNWNVGGAVSGAFFALAVIGVRRILRDGPKLDQLDE
jgi:hypothetical protein